MSSKILFGYIAYGAIPLAAMLWAISAGSVKGVGSFFTVLGRITICYAVALALSEFFVGKIAVLNSESTGESKRLRDIVRFVFYVVAFFTALLLLGVMLLGDSVGGNDDPYPYMRR